jgi:molybdate transport system permease protein
MASSRPLASKRLARGAVLWLVSLPMLVFLVVPLLALVWRSLPIGVLARIADPGVAQAISLSMTTTAVTVALTLLAGTPLAYALARRRFAGRTAVEALVDLPVVLPPAVAGIALLVTFGRRGIIGHALAAAGLTLPFTPAAVVMAQLFVAAPLYIKAAASAFAEVRPEIEEAAAIDGAAPWQIFLHVTLPLVLPAIISGAVMTWARALGEFGATIIFAGNFPGRTQTIPLSIYLGFEIDLDTALALAAVLLAVAFGVLLLVRGILRRRIA